jgi:hypothetical protein
MTTARIIIKINTVNPLTASMIYLFITLYSIQL